jgi:demethylmenaquinone methyltransferase/2-methoxy-6-polyprenyl-1,4-benzoquinol methylase
VSQAPSRDGAKIRAMFSDISPHYDFMNGLMTGGRHHAWRRAAAREAAKDLEAGGVALDACAGTGDLALAVAREAAGCRVIGTDFSANMLGLAKGKAAGAASFARADTLRLPFRDRTFRAVTIGWGARNLENLADGLRELARVLAPGGRLHLLESVPPRSLVGRIGFRVWVRGVVPLVGRLFGRSGAYSYLPNSVTHFPEPDTLSTVIRECGFRDVTYRTFAFGGVTFHSATRQETP